ncbi:MAG: addiction module protein [Pirellulaceae bacterium]
MGDEIRKLSAAQRILLVEEIWDSLLEDSTEFPLSLEQREELDRRLEDCERNPNDCEPWEEVRKRLRDKL